MTKLKKMEHQILSIHILNINFGLPSVLQVTFQINNKSPHLGKNSEFIF